MVDHCSLKLLVSNTLFSGSHSGRPQINDESCIDPDLCKEYINKGLNDELLPVLYHKSYAQNFCKVGLFILPDLGQHEKKFLKFS